MFFRKFIIYSIIVSLLLSNSIGLYLIFIQIKWYHKQNIKTGIVNNSINQIVVVLSFAKKDLERGIHKIDFIERDEFRLDGKLFDIILKWETKDSVFYKCINDTKEEELEKSFVNYVINNIHRQDIPLPIKNFFNALKIEYFISSSKLDFALAQLFQFKSFNETIHLENNIEIPDPPPRLTI